MTALQALSDPTRQRIVEMLAGGALSSGEIAGRFKLSPPAISQHLKTLREARLVSVRTDKQKRIYTLDPDGVTEISDWVERIRAFWNPKLDALEAALASSSEAIGQKKMASSSEAIGHQKSKKEVT
jgi:DNA-binding transcriptional ArsR family regulator